MPLILRAIKRIAHPLLERLLPPIGLSVRHGKTLGSRGTIPDTSLFGEREIIEFWLSKFSNLHKFCVDIGASDGVTMSNSFFLYGAGWSGLSIEASGSSFASLAFEFEDLEGVKLYRTKVYPENVLSILDSAEVPNDFDFLSLDIDGYDYFVLASILQKYRPKLICTEINEKIPPPICFTVLPDKAYSWGGDLFFGQSLSQVSKLCEIVNYKIVEVQYNNAFLAPKELVKESIPSIEELYSKGYLNKQDRLARLPWNREFEPIYKMGSEEAISFIKEKYKKYDGRYTIGY